MSYHLATKSLSGMDDVLPDNTTPAEREMVAAFVSQLVFDWSKKLDDILSGRLSLTTMFKRGAIFTMDAINARSSMVRAKDQLNKDFLPAALNAVRDYNRKLAEVKESIIGYVNQLEGQMQSALATEERSRLENIFDEAVRVAARAGRRVLDNIAGETPMWQKVLIGIVGLGTVGYFIRSVR